MQLIFRLLVCIAASLAELLETNVINFLAEAAAAQVHVVFTDDTVAVGALDAAARAGTHRFRVRVPDL